MSDKTDILNFKFIRAWIQRILPNSQALALAIILIAGFLLIYMLSNLLMPLFASIVLAYLLEGIIVKIENKKCPRFPAVLIVYTGFLTSFGYLLFVLLPMLYEQTMQLIQHVPEIIDSTLKEIMRLPELYPQFIS